MIAAAAVAVVAAALQAAAPTAAGETQAPKSDAEVVRLGGGTLLLAQGIDGPLFSEEAAVSQFRRIGIESACGIYNRALDAATATYKPRFEPFLVSAMRRHVPAELLGASPGWPWGSGRMLRYEVRIRTDVERDASDVLAAARKTVRDAFLSDAARQPEAKGDAVAGRFADWDLDRYGARKVACLILRGPAEHVAARKLPFNGFFSKKGVQ